MVSAEQIDTVSDEIQWFVEYFNKNPSEMYKHDMSDILCEYYQIQKLLSTKTINNLNELVLENIYVNPRLVCPTPHVDDSGIMKDNNVSSFALFQSSEPDYADMKFNSHSDIEHILNESAFTFPSSVLSSIDLANLNFPIFDDESFDSSKEFSFDDFDSQNVKSQNDTTNIRVHSQNSLDSSSFTSEETESDIYFTAFDCLDLLEQFEAVESLEPSPVKKETVKAPIGVAHLRGSVSILKKSIDRTLSDILVNIKLDHNYCRREDAGPPTKKRKLNIEEYKNRKGLPRSTYETTVESENASNGKVDEKTALQKYHQKVNELKMKVLIAQPKSKIGGSRSPILPADVISPKIEVVQELTPPKMLIPKVEVSPIIIIPKTEVETSPLLTPKSEISCILTPKPEVSPPIIEPVVPQESKPSIVVKSIGINTDLTSQNESHRTFLEEELAQISKMSAIVEKAPSKFKSTSLITAMMQNIKDKQNSLLISQGDGALIEVEDAAAVTKKLKSCSETVDAIAQTDLTLSKNLFSKVLVDPISSPSTSRTETEDSPRVDMKKASCERRILYVGDLTLDCSKPKLRKRFEKFGKILQITLHFKRNGKYYGFIVYDDIAGVSAAIDNGNKVPDGPLYYLNFGGRKEFLDDQTYFDFDSHPENRNSSSSRPKTYEEELLEYESLRDGRNS